MVAGVSMARSVTAADDEVPAGHDLLVMPTLPLKATGLPEPDCPMDNSVARALEMLGSALDA
jgi:amidase